MRILLVSGVYPPDIGGPSAQTQQIAQGLQQRNLEVCVVTYGDPALSGVVNGVQVFYIDSRRRPGLPRKLSDNMQRYATLRSIVDQQRPDVIHMQTANGPLALITGIVARQRRTPSLLKYTGDLVWETINKDRLQPDKQRRTMRQNLRSAQLELFQRGLFHLYSCVWATTPRFQQQVAQIGLPPERVVLLPNFIDLRPFEQIAAARASGRRRAEHDRSADEITLLTVSRLRPWKGVDVCIEAMAQLAHLPIRLIIAGDGSAAYTNELKALAQRLGVHERVEFAGSVPPDQVAAMYQRADLFLLASRYEPFGIVLVEAMAAGLPVIASDVGGIPFVIERNVSGLLVPSGNARALARTIRALIEQPALADALATAGRQQARRFGFAHGLDALVDVYQGLIRRHGSNRGAAAP